MRDSVRRFCLSIIILTVAAAALFLGVAPQASAATIAYAGFEETGDTWLGVSISGTATASSDTGAGQYPNLARIFEGLRSLQATNGIATVDFDNVDISAFDSVQITLRVSSTSTTSGNGNDAGDTVKLFVALNGAAFSLNPDLTLTGLTNAQWGVTGGSTGSTVAGTVKSVTGSTASPISTLVITIPNSATSVDFRIVTESGLNEYWNIDAVTITGTVVPEPSVAMSLIGGVGMLLGLRRMRRLAR